LRHKLAYETHTTCRWCSAMDCFHLGRGEIPSHHRRLRVMPDFESSKLIV
jgi:hypothetical protein